MKIEITNIGENKSISLLTEIIKISQEESKELSAAKSQLEVANRELKDKVTLLEATNRELEGKITKLETEKRELEDKVVNLKTSNGEFENKVTKLEDSNGEYESKVSKLEAANEELESKVTKLEASNGEYEGKVSKLESIKGELEGKVTKLETTNGELEDKANKLVEIRDMLEKKILQDKLKLIRLSLNKGIVEVSTGKWMDYLRIIETDLSDTIDSESTVEEILFKIQAKNGWLTKLASIYWWSNESHIKDYIPYSFGSKSIFSDLFKELIDYLNSQNIQINLPYGDFSSDLLNYKADYDEKSTWVKDLFPEYKPNEFVLCEINYLSINSNQGKCTGINP